MKEAFVEWRPHGATLVRVAQCEAIVNEYKDQGLRLTLRQLYYQLVSRDLIPNTEKSYKSVGNILSQARLAGLIDWNAIEDRGRQPRNPPEYDNIQALVDAALWSYRLPRWEGQQKNVELWVEKEALAGVLQPLASEFHVTLMVNKGYSSQSAMYASAQRISKIGKDTIIFYLGDHDPSGEDMVRDVQDRLRLFLQGEIDLDVEKLALTTAQVRQYRPPPNPAKMSDSRARAYVAKHGRSSWEVDALNPSQLQKLIRDAFEEVIDQELMDEIMAREETDKAKLQKAAKKI